MAVTFGRGSYIHKKAYSNTFEGEVIIENYVSIAKGMTFLAGTINHDSVINNKNVCNYNFGPPTPGGKIVIKSDVWIGTNSMIVASSDITIGEGAIIGAGSVIRSSIPPYAITVGNPAKIMGYRFPPEIIEKLLRIKWWDWPEELITVRLPKFTDIDEFVKEFDMPSSSNDRILPS